MNKKKEPINRTNKIIIWLTIIAILSGLSGVTVYNVIKEIMHDHEIARANKYCLEGKYTEAEAIYDKDEYLKNKAVQINLGYIWSHGLSDTGMDVNRAIERYEITDCIESRRNMFALLVRNNRREEAGLLMGDILSTNDTVFYNYVLDCLDKGIDYYYEDGILNTVLIMQDIFRFERTGEYVNSYNPPMDSELERWVISDLIFSVGENINHPTPRYEQEMPICIILIDEIEKMYYMNHGQLYELY